METDVVKRLKRVEGQIRGVINMVEEDKFCEDILIQISSARSALTKAGKIVLEGHIRRCVSEGIRGGEEEALKKLSSALEQFSRIV